MKGLMMDYPLTLTHFLERAAKLFPRKEIVSQLPSGTHRYTYADLHRRARRLASALERLGVRPGDRVATFAWNHHRHLELYFAVPGLGAVLHTLNIRLFPDQIAYIVNHAEDKLIVVDDSLLPVLEKLQDKLQGVQGYVVMADGPLPETTLAPVYSYEELVEQGDEAYEFPRLDEDDAAIMCYTSGTTGNPKGCLYSHKALVVHTLVECLPDCLGLSERDVVMPIVPMFHVNAWGLPFAATLVGAKQVHPGPFLHPRDVAALIQQERVTITAGVPTIWIGLYELLKTERYDLSSLRGIIVGGSAVPKSLIEGFERDFGLQIVQAWGMTEMSPLGTVSRPKSHLEATLPKEELLELRAKQGIPAPFVELRAVDDQGREVPWDGRTMGELQVRGPWIIREYYHDLRTREAFDRGWFRTGDVVTIDPEGYIRIVDRTKDLVKSGGEWISSVELENAIMAHPKVLEAAVIAIPHPKWQERPLAVVVPKDEFKGQITKKEILEFLSGKFAKWWLPDDVVFVERLPKTSVGKFDKKALRKQFESYTWPPREEEGAD